MGTAHGSGPSNNGFVANTANIDQSNKNTSIINVYQFSSGVNFNLKLGPGQTAPTQQ